MKRYKFLIFNIYKKRKLCRFSIILFSIIIVLFISIMGIKNDLKEKYYNLKQENNANIIEINGSSIEQYDKLINNIDIFTEVISFFLLLLIIIVNCIIIHDNKMDIALLKSFGFSNMKISILIFTYSIQLLLLACVPSMFIIGIIQILFKDFLSINLITITNCLLCFIIIFIFTMLIINILIRRINIIKLIQT